MIFRYILFLSLVGVALLKNCKKSVTTVNGKQNFCNGQLIFEDNFNSLDTKKWQPENTLSGGGNWEFEWYSPDKRNSYVQNGVLHIKPTLLADEKGNDFLYKGTITIPANQCTNAADYGCSRTGSANNILNPIKSARLRTINSFSFKFGTLETRAKTPAGDWLWPAIWLLPKAYKYGGWPRSGEIDLLESRGNKNLQNPSGLNIGTQQVASTLHWGPDAKNNRFYKTHYEKNNANGYDTGFHLYKVVWTPNDMTFFVDNQQIGKVVPPQGGFWQLGDLARTGLKNPWTNSKMAPFDQEFHILINLAVGGTTGYFPEGMRNPKPKPWKNGSPTAMKEFWEKRGDWLPTWNMKGDTSHLQVDYVKVWAL
ncbi:unnamed protein product [Acanthoscelides obtectus]|uniref:GH16 domain-containing protein n=1 Tax=Acanthoscelides obtectus TaxID=200917 RepID=A0A9P0LUU8_ACAOB|nr:unnamed protein product [Acanthoscelides obtectus]CAK1635443.1 hypothetical protein AOBTE_LOCUS9276 [Acanthoscelides obtectus]